MNLENPKPRVGIGILILNNQNEALLGLRIASHGTGEWSFPGGHLEFGETIFQCAQREVLEETGLLIDDFELISVSDEMRYMTTHQKHYLNLGVVGKYQGGIPQVLEPEKCKEWQWFPFNSLPENLFEATFYTIKNYRDKKVYQPNQNYTH